MPRKHSPTMDQTNGQHLAGVALIRFHGENAIRKFPTPADASTSGDCGPLKRLQCHPQWSSVGALATRTAQYALWIGLYTCQCLAMESLHWSLHWSLFIVE